MWTCKDPFAQASLEIAAGLDIDRVLTAIAEQACRITGGDSSAVYLADDKIEGLCLVTGWGVPEGVIGTTLLPKQGLAWRAIAEGVLVAAPGAPDWAEADLAGPAPSPHARLAIGLAAGPGNLAGASAVEWLGVVEVVGEQFDAQACARLVRLAPYAARALLNARSFQAARQSARRLAARNEILRTVGNIAQAILDSGYHLQPMASEALDRTLASLGLAGGGVYVCRDEPCQLQSIVARNLPEGTEGEALKCVAGAETGATSRALVSVCAWPASDAEPELASRGVEQLLASLPLMSGSTITGVLQVLTRPGKTVSPDDVGALLIVANQLALGIQNACLIEQARAEHRRLQAILASTADIVLSVDREGCLTLCNAAAERALGFTAAHYMGRPLKAAIANEAINAALEQAIASSALQQRRFEVPLTGDQVWFASLSPVLGTEGDVQGYVMVMQDISQFKRLERERAGMILMASHELRNPLNLTIGALELLARFQANMDDTMCETLGLAQLGAQRAESLIRDLLDLERVEQRVGLTMTVCDLTEIARLAAAEFKLSAVRKAIRFELELEAGRLLVWGDAGRLTQAISNLLGNAFKYTPAGGGVTLRLCVQPEHGLIQVADTGPGIAQAAQARIFERFYRAPGQPENVEGTGLGLAIVKSIVDYHGGRVWVISETGKGATFTILLPKLPPNYTEYEKQ